VCACVFSFSDDESIEACRATSSQTDLLSTFSDSCSSWPPSPCHSSRLLSDDDGYDVIDDDSDDDNNDLVHDSFANRQVKSTYGLYVVITL